MKIITCNIDKLEKTTFYFNKKEFSLQDVKYIVSDNKITCIDSLSKKQVIFTKKELSDILDNFKTTTSKKKVK
jgi:hypothetical protein